MIACTVIVALIVTKYAGELSAGGCILIAVLDAYLLYGIDKLFF